jgi:hypothetical protein
VQTPHGGRKIEIEDLNANCFHNLGQQFACHFGDPGYIFGRD